MATDNLPRDSKGLLESFAWPGGYPVFYLDQHDNVLCPDCARESESEGSSPVCADCNWEDESLFCDECGNQIESAYGDD